MYIVHSLILLDAKEEEYTHLDSSVVLLCILVTSILFIVPLHITHYHNIMIRLSPNRYKGSIIMTSSIYSQEDDNSSVESECVSYLETCSSSSTTVEYQERDLDREQEQKQYGFIRDDNERDDDSDYYAWANFHDVATSNCHPFGTMQCGKFHDEDFDVRVDGPKKISLLQGMLQYEPCIGEEDMTSFSVSEQDHHDIGDIDDYDDDAILRYENQCTLDHSSTYTSLYGHDSKSNLQDRPLVQTKWARARWWFLTDQSHVDTEDSPVYVDFPNLDVQSQDSLSSLSSCEQHGIFSKRAMKYGTNGGAIESVVNKPKHKHRPDETLKKKRFGCLSRLLKPCKTM